VPRLSRLANLWDPTQPGVAAYWPDVRQNAKALGMSVDSVPASDTPGLERALAKLTQDRPGGLFVWGGPKYFVNRQAICEWAVKVAIPTLALAEQYVEAGCLMSYAPNLMHLQRGVAEYVDKILRGGKPAELPVSRPSKFELVINARTARSLGLTIPPSLLLRADRVVE
jgi:putative ABC transport system substrate-binding protein